MNLTHVYMTGLEDCEQHMIEMRCKSVFAMIAGSVLRGFQRGRGSVRLARSFVARGKRKSLVLRKTKPSARAKLINDEYVQDRVVCDK
jgi:hypothetical protein